MATQFGTGSGLGGFWGIEWVTDPLDIADELDRYGDRLVDDLVDALQPVAQDMVSYARASHPWTNRTYEAEENLESQVYAMGEEVGIVLSQGDLTRNHGYWLEVIKGGVWGVVPQTIAAYEARAMAVARRAVFG